MSCILEGCLTPPPPIVINRHILAYPPAPSITIILSYFDIPPFTFHINIKSAFIFNPVEIIYILFSLNNHPHLHFRDHFRSNCKNRKIFCKFYLISFGICTFFSILSYCHTIGFPPTFQPVINRHILAYPPPHILMT